MKYVYVVLECIPYEGDTVMRVYENKEDAEEYARYLDNDNEFGFYEYKVKEEKLHIHTPAWSLANDDHR